MKKNLYRKINFLPLFMPAFLLSLLMIFHSCMPNHVRLDNYEQVNLVANTAAYNSSRIDPLFKDGWGFAFSPFGPAFIANNGGSTCVAYGTDGAERRTPIGIPGAGEVGTGHPAGTVFNNTDLFQLSDFNPARFIFAGTDGVISAWNAGDNAELIKNNSPAASYTGIAIAQDAGVNFLYVANFGQSRIEVYDGSFNEVVMSFTDPTLPANYSPFNIQSIDGKLYVMYARKGTGVETGSGRGYVSIFNTDGSFSRRLISAGKLNAPWGIVKASAPFLNINSSQTGILIGNFGDGKINAYSQNGSFLATLPTETAVLQINGLWDLKFAPDSAIADQGKLFFTAGPNGGADGLFGYIQNAD